MTRLANDWQGATAIGAEVAPFEDLERDGEITDLREQVEVLTAERQRYAELYDDAPVGLALLDPRGLVVEANETAAQALGVPRAALRGTALAQHLAVADRAALAEHLYEVTLSEARRASVVVRCARRPEAELRLETTARWTGVGRVMLRTALLDAAPQRRAEQDLAERVRRDASLRAEVAAAERRFARIAAVGSMLAESLDLAETLDRAARVPVPEFAAFCAVDVADDAGRVRRGASAASDPSSDLPLDPYAPRGSASVVRTGRPLILLAPEPADILALAAEPAHLPRLWSRVGAYLCLPLRARGRVIGALTLVRPARDPFHEEDVAVAEELARHAALVIDNALLYREAHEADRRKDEFLAMLGHELRNPLAAIVMAAGRLRWSGARDPAVLRATDVVERQSERLSRIVDDLLDVSRIVHGKIVLRPERISLRDAVDRAVESARPALDARRHELTVTAPDEPVLLDADPARVEQVIVNLLTNAARYTEPGGRVAVIIERAPDAAVVRVRDNGTGIAPDMLSHIFEPFTRAGADMDRGDRGLGIGLTLARALVDLHGGRLTAHSAGPGMGSEFIVRLPLPPEVSLPAAEGPVEAPAVSPSRRVLIVEDEPDVAEMMQERLLGLGHDAVIARDGIEAVEAAIEHRPELLFIDLGLPGMSGYDVVRRLRRESTLAGSTFVALTGYGDEGARRRSAEAGFDRHFTKPIPDEALARLLSTL